MASLRLPVKCHTCAKTVYAMERMDADGKVFHKTCMKCEHCACRLSLGNYAALNGKYYCKTHFKQLFKTKGNYTEGFGEEDAKKKWSPQVSHFNMSGVNFGAGSSTLKQRAVTVGPISQVGSHKAPDVDAAREIAPAPEAQAPAEAKPAEADAQATVEAESNLESTTATEGGAAPVSTEGEEAQAGGSAVQCEASAAGEAVQGNGSTEAATDSTAGQGAAADNSGDVA